MPDTAPASFINIIHYKRLSLSVLLNAVNITYVFEKYVIPLTFAFIKIICFFVRDIPYCINQEEVIIKTLLLMYHVLYKGEYYRN